MLFYLFRFSEILDLEYTVNNQKFEKHRALHLVNITRQFTGSYMCKVVVYVYIYRALHLINITRQFTV